MMAMEPPLVEATEPLRAPEETRFLEVRAEPYPDGSRLRLHVRLTPFEQRPDIDIAVFNEEGEEIGSTTVVQAFLPILSLTMHLRPSPGVRECLARLLLRYPELETVDERQVRFLMRQPASGGHETDAEAG